MTSARSVPHTAAGSTGMLPPSVVARRMRNPTPGSARFIPGSVARVPSTKSSRRPPRFSTSMAMRSARRSAEPRSMGNVFDPAHIQAAKRLGNSSRFAMANSVRGKKPP